MDLTYQVNGDNQHHIRLLSDTFGSSAVTAFDSSSKAVFSIWCGNNAPSSEYHVWWQNTSLGSIDKIVSYAKQQIELHKNINIMILEHSAQSILNITFFVLVSKDNIVRTFQSEKDICLCLKEIAARYD